MAEKGFGVKEINLIGASGTPSIDSPNNLNLNAVNVAISTNVSIGGTLSVSGNVSVGGTLTYNDVTNIDSVGLITARSGIKVTGGEIVVGNNIKIGNAGVITATQFVGDGSQLSGISGGGGGGVTVQDEGSSLSTTATTLNFVGAGVVATGTGATKTITIAGGGGGSSTPADDDIQVVYTVTGSGVYNFTGNGVDSSVNYPTIYMYRDTKYRFIHNAGTNHPIQIRTSNQGSAYTDGVTYSNSGLNRTEQGGNLDFTPPHDAPSTLYYQCTSHGNMIGTIKIIDFNLPKERGNVTGTTGSLAQNAIGNITITGHKSYLLMNVALSAAGWIRLYTDSASRTNDASRSVGEDPLPGSGVIAEVVTTASSLTQKISPFVPGGNMDATPSTNIYVAIQNLSSSTQTITATLTILKLED